MQAPPSQAPSLLDQIERLRTIMLNVHYFNEAQWLDVALRSTDLCRSESARNALEAARVVAQQFGFPAVADWIATDVLGR